jgi:L-ribulose-5-phosphate 3-epimerase
MKRREFLKKSALTSAALSLGMSGFTKHMKRSEELFDISLAQWSVNSLLFSGEIDNLEFPVLAKNHGINAVEYVNQFFMDKAEDKNYLSELRNRCASEGVTSVLIMCDREGQLGASDSADRFQTVENHKKWVEAARFLGCHSIRVNAYTDIPWSEDTGIAEEAKKLVSDGMRQLCEFADGFDINILIENHGGYSSDPYWLADVIEITHHPRAGTLPDFGNFRIYGDDHRTVSFDSYKGTDLLMPKAKGVSLKPVVWDDYGNRHDLDYLRMMKIVLEHGYHGYVGIEHGERGREWESIAEIRDILTEVRGLLAE